MKRNYRHRLLAYEQLESKAAPSSVLMVISGDSVHAAPTASVGRPITTGSSLTNEFRCETEQILRFVAENTIGGERSNRDATLPTAGQCAAADEMMKRSPAEWDSFLVLGYFADGTEL
jgi:hypothetical protein